MPCRPPERVEIIATSWDGERGREISGWEWIGVDGDV